MQVYYHIRMLATELRSLSIWSNFKVFPWHSYRTRHHLNTGISGSARNVIRDLERALSNQNLQKLLGWLDAGGQHKYPS